MPFSSIPRAEYEAQVAPVHRDPSAHRLRPEKPGWMDVFGAAFRRENSIGSFFNYLNKPALSGIVEPGFNPLDPENIQGYEDHEDFIANNIFSQVELNRFKSRVDKERRDRSILAAGGAKSFVAMIATGAVDPINFIPVGGALIKSAKAGRTILRTAAIGSTVAGVSSLAQEIPLQATQDERTAGESAMNVTGAALLGGVLGGASGFISKKVFNKTAKAIEADFINPKNLGDETKITVAPEFKKLTSEVSAATDNLKQMGLFDDVAGELGAPLPDQKLAGSLGFAEITAKTNPLLRVFTSGSDEASIVMQNLADNPFTFKKNLAEAGAIATPDAAETAVKYWTEGVVSTGRRVGAKLYKEYRSAAKKLGDKPLTKVEFNEAVGRAIVYGSDSPAINKAAKFWQTHLFKPLAEQGVASNVLTKESVEKMGDKYFPRVWRLDKIRNELDSGTDPVNGIVDRIVKWAGQRGVTPDQARPRARALLLDMLRTPGGRLPDEISFDLRGAAKARTFPIPDSLVEDYLIRDIETVGAYYSRSMGSDVEIAKRFGSPSMSEALDKVAADFDKKIAAERTPSAQAKLNRLKENTLRDISAVRDRVRGVYMLPVDPLSFPVQAGHVIRAWNYATLLGRVVVSSLADAVRPVMVHGILRTTGTATRTVVSGLRAAKLANAELRAFGVGADWMLNGLARSRFDATETFSTLSNISYGAKSVSDKVNVWNGFAIWNTAAKRMAGFVTQARILKNIERVGAGKKVSAKELSYLAKVGIDAETAAKMAQMPLHNIRGTRVANVAEWTDARLVEIYRNAILKEVNTIVVTPGAGDLPLFASSQLGKLLFQFRSFGFAASNRILASGLQQRDMAFLNGAILSTMVGTLSYAAKLKLAGREIPEDPKELLLRGFDQSGLTAWFYDASDVAMRGSNADENAYDFKMAMLRLAGPSLQRLLDLYSLGKAGARGAYYGENPFDQKDVEAMRRMIPLQNAIGFSAIFDAIESEVKEDLPKNKRFGRSDFTGF